MKNIGIIGWERILPELATFFTALKMREKSQNDMAPFNLFLSGRPGTNKTVGITHLCQMLGYSVGKIDCSTLDDVAELAGVIDIHANRTQGISKIIEGELLNKDILILDEFLNAKPHVVPQFRLMLQRRLILLAKEVPMNIKCLIATANLSEDMDAGEANVLDSPTADRFAMLIKVPSFSELNADEKSAVIEKLWNSSFEKTLYETVEAAGSIYKDVEYQARKNITRYVRAVLENLAEAGKQESKKNPKTSSSSFSFEGRRAQILWEFSAAALAIEYHSGVSPQKCQIHDALQKSTIACLSIAKLSGENIKQELLHNAHLEGAGFLKKGLLNETEIEIFDAPTIMEQIGIMIRHMKKVGLTTKIDLLNDAMKHTEPEMKLAALELLHSEQFADEPAEFQNMAKEIGSELAKISPNRQNRALPDSLPEIAYNLPYARPYALLLSGGNADEFVKLMDKTKKIVEFWGVTQP